METPDDPLALTPPPKTETTSDYIAPAQSVPGPVAASGPESVRGTLSRKGEPYDPSVHVYPPRENKKSGEWRKRKHSGETKGGDIHAPPAAPNAEYRKAAQESAEMYATLHELILGKEAAPESADDLVPMTNAWERYYQANGMPERSPGMSVALAMVGYTHGILRRPAFWPRVKEWATKSLIWLKILKAPEEEDGARNDSGNNGQRKVVPSEKDGGGHAGEGKPGNSA